MKKIWPILLIAGGIGIMLFRQGSDIVDNLDYTVTNAKIDKSKSTIGRLIGSINVNIMNPTNTGFSFKGLNSDFIFKNTRIAKVFWQQNVTVKPNATTTIQIPFTIPTSDLASSLTEAVLDFLDTKKFPAITVAGEIRFSAGSLKINVVKDFSLT